jgi:hypothetical protein
LAWLRLGGHDSFLFISIPAQLSSFRTSLQLRYGILMPDFASQKQNVNLRFGFTSFDVINTIFHLGKCPIAYTMKRLLTRAEAWMCIFWEALYSCIAAEIPRLARVFHVRICQCLYGECFFYISLITLPLAIVFGHTVFPYAACTVSGKKTGL